MTDRATAKANLLVRFVLLGLLACVSAALLWAISVPKEALADDPKPSNQISLKGRNGEAKEKLLKEWGGTKESEAAVAAGLKWLADHQSSDGHWSMENYQQTVRCHCQGVGQANDIAATALGVLPFLGAGYTHKKPPSDASGPDYSRTVLLALDYLKAKQGSDGFFGASMYAHGLATIAMCEAYGMTVDTRYSGAAQKGLNLIVKIQHDGGGWRYSPAPDPGDTSVFGWQIPALKTGKVTGFAVPEKTFKAAIKYLDSVQNSDGSSYGYTTNDPNEMNPTHSAIGLLCREYLGWTPQEPGLKKGIEIFNQNPPGTTHSIYYDFYATQVLHHVGGDDWRSWNEKMRDYLIKTQDKGDDDKHAHQRGSWSPQGDVFAMAGGRIYQTSLSLLSLEVYYRHLPLFEDSKAEKKDQK
jgi:hypothetical protein